MWVLTIYYHGQEPFQVELEPGVTSIGRRLDNDIILSDTSVSRLHSEIEYKPEPGQVVIRDLGSANGTLVNGRLILRGSECRLHHGDLVQIGLHEIRINCQPEQDQPSPVVLPKSHISTSQLSLRPLDRRATLIYKTARQLNTVLDTDSALQKVSGLILDAMEADKAEIILAREFYRLRELGFSRAIAQRAIESKAPFLVPNAEIGTAGDISDSAGRLLIYSALCVPVINGGKVTAVIYIYKTNAEKRPFDETDVQLVEAISHMVSLTLERLDLFERVTQEQKLRQILERHLAPERVEYLMQNYLRTGRLPGLDEAHATVLFADIADSTGMAERLGARRFGEVLKQYYQDTTQLVFEYGGLLDKYLGDGIMVTFGMSENQANPERRAVGAGMAMLDMVEKGYSSGDTQLHLGVGVNTGPVVAGYVTTMNRIEFTVLGDAVNVAFRLQEIARPNKLYIGQETYEAVQQDYNACHIGAVAVKGRRQPMQIYEVAREVAI